MDQQQIIAALEERAKGVGLTMGKVCEYAKVHPTTFSRWKKSDKNPKPIGATLPLLSRIEAVISRAEGHSERLAS